MAPQLLVPVHERVLPSTPPDIIEFVCSDQYLGRTIYPRQATLLKTIFLQTELFTQFDYRVLSEWAEREFVLPPPENWDAEKPYRYTGQWGIQPDILERIDLNRQDGRKWFREVLAVIGRRGGKGYIGALSGAYVLWHYLCLVDPQAHYAIARDKRLAALVFAGKKEQAKQNQWRDLINVLISAPCFQPYISQSLGESLTMHSKVSLGRGAELASQGVKTSMDLASFEILPKEATPMAGRGPAGFCLDPSTLVLKTDLTWVPIGDLVVGDRVIGPDEYPEAPGKQRKLRDAEVQAVRRTRKEAVRLTFDDGSSVVCSLDHQWMKRDQGTGAAYLWAPADKLRVGHSIRSIVDPWEQQTSFEAGYLRGFFDGEATIPRCANPEKQATTILYSQNPGPVLEEVHRCLDEMGYARQPNGQGAYPSTPGDRECEQWALRGLGECLRFMGEISPIRLRSKQRLLWENRSLRGGNTPTGRGGRPAAKMIVAIESLPEQELVDIQTSTRTFLAEGLVSHNCLFFDEMAHVVATGASRGADELYTSATPSLDQFGVDGFIYAGSSPWQMMGQFYDLCQQALEVEFGSHEPVHPDKLLVQLSSWDIYEDWDKAHKILRIPANERTYTFLSRGEENPITNPSLGFHYIFARAEDDTLVPVRSKAFDPIARPIQQYDEQMQRLERANPETFAVERRSRWAASLDSYLNPVLVDRMFEPWQGRTLTMQEKGILNRTYVAHGDPSKSGANFGWAIAHAEGPDANGFMHVVFDKIHFWAPWTFEDGQIDYVSVEKDILSDLKSFMPELVTFDQFSSGPIMSHLRLGVSKSKLPKRITIDERTSTAPQNWAVAETFKTAIGLNLVHMPYFEQAELECKFLQVKGNKVDHPSMGPVQTKDVYDAVSNCVWGLIGSQMEVFLRSDLSRVSVHAAGEQMAMGQTGSVEANHDRDIFDAFGSSSRRRRPMESEFVRRGPKGWR